MRSTYDRDGGNRTADASHYSFPNQTAEVFIGVDGEWKSVGIWYLAGSNTFYHSYPNKEKGGSWDCVYRGL